MADLKQELASLRLEREPASGGRGKTVVLMVVLALIAAVAVATWRFRSDLTALEVETVHAAIVTPQQADEQPVLSASGYVVARRKAVVSAKIQGRLSTLKVEEGSRVREGEVIARLESADYEASVERARAAVQRAEADLAETRRQLRIAERLAEEKVASQDAADAARSRVRIAEAALAQAHGDLNFAQAQLQNTFIQAPFTGTVVKKMAEVGESVAPIPPGVNISTSSGAIVALADLDTLEVEADVAEANVARLSTNQPAEVTVEAIPDRSYKAVLRQIIPTADRTKATVQVKVTILDRDRNLKPEMSAKVNFLAARAKPEKNAKASQTRPAISVPTDAIATRGGRSVVFEVREGKAVQHEIKTSGEWKGRSVVTQGLGGSELLVAHPPDRLKDGDAVKVKS